MKDFGFVEEKLADVNKSPNKEWAERKAKYVKRFFGKLYTEEEVLQEVKKLLEEGNEEVIVRVIVLYNKKQDKFEDEVKVKSDLLIKRKHPLNDEVVLGYLIQGAQYRDTVLNLQFYFDFTQKIENKLTRTIYESFDSCSVEKSRLVEYGCSNREFESTEDVRNFVLDNRDEYDGYIVRSYNGWDSDTIYRWQELANGKIIWRKEKA